jgi:hypothetical protein
MRELHNLQYPFLEIELQFKGARRKTSFITEILPLCRLAFSQKAPFETWFNADHMLSSMTRKTMPFRLRLHQYQAPFIRNRSAIDITPLVAFVE